MQSFSSPFDRKLVLENLGDDEDLFRQIAQLFIADWPDSLKRMHAAVAANDAEAVRIAAHSIKGAVSNFAATVAVQAAKDLEMAGRAGDLAQVPKLTTAMIKAVEEVIAALRLDIGA